MRTNEVLARMFEELGDALAFLGENPFKVNAYKKAARALRDMPEPVEDLVERDTLREIPGIGEAIAKKIEEYLETGKIRRYEEAMAKLPKGMMELMNLEGVGPKTLRLLSSKFEFHT